MRRKARQVITDEKEERDRWHGGAGDTGGLPAGKLKAGSLVHRIYHHSTKVRFQLVSSALLDSAAGGYPGVLVQASGQLCKRRSSFFCRDIRHYADI